MLKKKTIFVFASCLTNSTYWLATVQILKFLCFLMAILSSRSAESKTFFFYYFKSKYRCLKIITLLKRKKNVSRNFCRRLDTYRTTGNVVERTCSREKHCFIAILEHSRNLFYLYAFRITLSRSNSTVTAPPPEKSTGKG